MNGKYQKPSSFLPFGENLRVLIAHSELSISNHKSLLNRKGVFLGNYDKNTTVPALMTVLLDPSEFSSLVEMQSKKEDKVKYRTLKLPWKTDIDILKAIPENFDINRLLKESTSYKPTFKVIGSPQFRKVKGEDKIELDFSIQRENYTKGWDERITIHTGSLTLEKTKSDGIQLVTTKTHTAKETDEVGEMVLKSLKAHFKDKAYIEKEDDFERILFNHFTNANRILFLFGFTSAFHGTLNFDKLTDLTVSPDATEIPPKEIKDFMEGIKNLRIQGKELQTHMLISKSQYHDKLIFSSLIVKYNFIMAEGNGNCTVEFVFSEYEDQKKMDSEFQFLLQKVNIDKGYRQFANKSKITRVINQALEAQKLYLYDKYKN